MSPENSSRSPLKEKLYNWAFFLVEAFAAMEVTAVIVANARIAESLGLREELSSLIINSYLYPLFAAMIALLLVSRWVRRHIAPTPLFLTGLGLFACGNVICALAHIPVLFFFGRLVMGLGGALSFAGQLWTLSSYYRRHIEVSLVWGEAGTALGVVAGPLVGAFFVQLSPGGWRDFFWLNGGMGLMTACFAYIALKGRPVEYSPDVIAPETPQASRTARIMTGWQVAVSMLIVGAEYFFSDYLQAKMGKSAMFVGVMTVLASIGAIIGSLWAARLQRRMSRLPAISTAGLLFALAVLAFCLEARAFLSAGLPIFICGLCMGLASVSIYANIVQASHPSRFLSRSMVYLIGMQIGNALGVQAVGLAELRHLGVIPTALMIAVLPTLIAVGIVAAGKYKSFHS